MASVALSLWAGVSLAGAAAWPSLQHPPVGSGLAGRHDAAVLVGVDDYTVLPDVPGAEQMVDDWYRWLARTRGVPLSRIHRLQGAAAEGSALRREVAEAASEVQPGGTVWLVFVGHAWPGADPVLLPVEAAAEAEGMRNRGVSLRELTAKMAEADRHHAVVVLDAGGAGLGAPGQPLSDVVPQPWSVPDAVDPGVTLLAAAGPGQDAGQLVGLASSEHPRPAFSYLVLGALHGWGDANADGQVTSDEAVAYAHGAIVATLPTHDQTPWHLGAPRVLAEDARVAGPDLVALATRPPGGPVSSIDFATEGASAAAIDRATEAAREAEAQARAAARAQDRRGMQRAIASVREQAAADWAALQPARDAAGPRSIAVVEEFIATYAEVELRVDGRDHTLRLPEADAASRWLDQTLRAQARRPLAPVEVATGTSPRDAALLRSWGKACSTLAEPDACANLGHRYEHGWGVTQDAMRALALYERSCRADSAVGCSNLGIALADGLVGEPDRPAALEWLELACAQGWGRACGRLGVMTGQDGLGEAASERSLTLLARGCTLGDGGSCLVLGRRHWGGDRGAELDPHQARRLLQRACSLGVSEGCEERGAEHPAGARP